MAANGDAGSDGEEESGVSPRKRARTAAVVAKECKEKAVVTREKVNKAENKAKNKAEVALPTTENCVLCDNAFPLPKLFGHVTSRHHVAADRYERVKSALAASERGELIK